MRSKITRYVSLICIAALGAGFALYQSDPFFSVAFARAALTFGLISILAQLLSYRTSRESSGSLSFIPVLATAAIAPHWTSVIAVFASALAAQVLGKKTVLKTVFNATQEALAISLAILA